MSCYTERKNAAYNLTRNGFKLKVFVLILQNIMFLARVKKKDESKLRQTRKRIVDDTMHGKN